MGYHKGPHRGSKGREHGKDKLALLQRAKEAIEYLMEQNGHVTLSKGEFAYVMGERYGKVWLRSDGSGNSSLVGGVCTLTREQEAFPLASSLLAGMVVAYAPSIGGMTLLDPSGEPSLDHLLHMLAGDMQAQQKHKTVNRRRVTYWDSGSKGAITHGHMELGLLMGQIKHEIDTTGFASDSLVADFFKLVGQLDKAGSP